jgi:2-polyprenyl-6-hydroxyphenyl methylase/3-demethylubiquinone-9 3-methyltransferase
MNDDLSSLWGFPIPTSSLTKAEHDYLTRLPELLPTVEWVWSEMDRVWQQLTLNNRISLTVQRVGDFYSHPVWLMNGIFTAVDPASAAHRQAIARYIASIGARSIADYGGGFGELAIAITRHAVEAEVAIVEPYPSPFSVKRLITDERIHFINNMVDHRFEVVVAQDVLEHVEDLVLLASQLANSVRVGGAVVFANSFYPLIQCHLPATFHLRHTFRTVMLALGLRYRETVSGASHAEVFFRMGDIKLERARRAERITRLGQPDGISPSRMAQMLEVDKAGPKVRC